MKDIKEKYIARTGLWLPASLSILLLIGAVVNNVNLNGHWTDFYFVLTGLVLLFASTKILKPRQIQLSKINPERQNFVRFICYATFLIAAVNYAVSGVPLLSDDPNVARMEFMQSTWTYKVLKIFVPFTLVYLSATVFVRRKNRRENSGYLVLAIVLNLLSGGKGAAIWSAALCLLGFGMVGGKINVRLILVFLLMFTLPTLYLFKVVADIDRWDAIFAFIMDRLTGTAEYGFYVVTHYVEKQLQWNEPLLFVSDLYSKLFDGRDLPYTLSFGRRVTGYFYGGDPYSYVWELTVTAFADFYVLFGFFGGALGIFLYFVLLMHVGNRVAKAKSLYVRSGWMILWYHLSLYILTGSLVTEFIVRTVPFVIFWTTGALGYIALSPQKNSILRLKGGYKVT